MDMSGFSVTHRRFGDGDEYRAVVARVLNGSGHPTEVIYYRTTGDGRSGVEVYTGSNYVAYATNRSWSRRYDVDASRGPNGAAVLGSVPKAYGQLVVKMIAYHDRVRWDDNCSVGR